MLIYEIVDQFRDLKLDYAIVGGYALALHGLVRATMDVDLVLNLKQNDFSCAELCLNNMGLQSRLPLRAKDVFQFREEYIQKRNLIAWSFVDYKNPTRQVDILITENFKDLETVTLKSAGRKIVVVSLQELLRMKQKSARPQDLLDIENIKALLNEKK